MNFSALIIGALTDVVEFPGLGISIPVNSIAFKLFGLEVLWYSVIIGSGVLLCWYIAYKSAPQFGLHSEQIFDAVFWGFLGGVIGARLYYVVFNFSIFEDDLLRILNFRTGGLAIYGGVIFGFLSAYIYCRIKKVKFLPVADAGGAVFLLGNAVGRWGNFTNMEAFGRNTSLPWGMTSEHIKGELSRLQTSLGENMGVNPDIPVHPCFLYESIWCFIGFFIINFFYKKIRKFDGEIVLFYLAWYGFGRFFIEGLRTDSLYIGQSTLRISQVLAMAMFVFSVILIIVMRLRVKKSDGKMPLYVNTSASRENIEAINAKIAADKNGKSDNKSEEKSEKAKKESPELLEEEAIAEEKEGE